MDRRGNPRAGAVCAGELIQEFLPLSPTSSHAHASSSHSCFRQGSPYAPIRGTADAACATPRPTVASGSPSFAFVPSSEQVAEHGTKHWGLIGSKLNGRTGKQCRERWHNQLDPTIRKDPWTREEEDVLLKAHAVVSTTPYGLRATATTATTTHHHHHPCMCMLHRAALTPVHMWTCACRSCAAVRKPLGRDREAPTWTDGQRREEPLELGQAEALSPGTE